MVIVFLKVLHELLFTLCISWAWEGPLVYAKMGDDIIAGKWGEVLEKHANV